MKTDTEGQLLRIFIGESDHYHSVPLFDAIMRKAKEMRLNGTTVLRGVAGFGANSVIHSARLLDFSGDLPIVIEMVDTVENINRILPVIHEMIEASNSGALITLEKAHIIKYIPSKK